MLAINRVWQQRIQEGARHEDARLHYRSVLSENRSPTGTISVVIVRARHPESVVANIPLAQFAQCKDALSALWKEARDREKSRNAL